MDNAAPGAKGPMRGAGARVKILADNFEAMEFA